MTNKRWKTQPNGNSSLIPHPSHLVYRVFTQGLRLYALRCPLSAIFQRAHKMYFLCKTNPMSSHPKMTVSTYPKTPYRPIGHLVNGKSKPNQTQSNPIVARPSWPRCHWPLAGDNLWTAFTPGGRGYCERTAGLRGNLDPSSLGFGPAFAPPAPETTARTKCTFYAKRTQFQETPNEPNPLYKKILR